jgi:hypothetical protein
VNAAAPAPRYPEDLSLACSSTSRALGGTAPLGTQAISTAPKARDGKRADLRNPGITIDPPNVDLHAVGSAAFLIEKLDSTRITSWTSTAPRRPPRRTGEN